jgi:uncharacterized protein YbjT (DUF2867 family)
MSAPLGVTGSTGQLGGRIARLLAAAGAEQRLVLRTPARAPLLPGTTVAAASYLDRDAVRRALDGLDVVLMVSAAEAENRLDGHRAFVDAAADAGVRHLVYISFLAAAPEATFTLARDHHVTEQHIEQSGMAWTHVRDNLYADFFSMMAGDDGVIRGPASDGRVSAVGAGRRRRRGHRGAARAGAPRGPHLQPHRPGGAHAHRGRGDDEPVARPALHRRGRDGGGRVRLPRVVRRARLAARRWVSTYTAIASGELAGVTGDVERLTGHQPMSLADLLGPTD